MSPEALKTLERHAAALEANTRAMETLQDSLDRFVRTNGELTGILTRSEEMREVKRVRRDMMNGKPGGFERLLEAAKGLGA